MGEVFLLLGPEKGLKEDFIKKTKASMGQCEVSRFYAVEDYEEELYAQLNNTDLFADKKLIILDNAEEVKTKAQASAIVDYIKNPSDTITFLIISTELYINAEIMACVKADNVLKFYELFENKKSEWLRNFFRRENLSISESACAAIIEKVDNNIQEFEAVCSQIVVYIKGVNRNSVDEADIEEFLAHTRQETVFTLFGYIAKKNLESALECLDALLNTNDEGESAALASRLAVFFRRLLSIKMLKAEGKSFDDAIGGKYFDSDRPIRMPKDKDFYRSADANYTLDDTKRILKKLAEFDIQIKESGTYIQQIVMEKCISDIIVRKGI